MLFLDPEYNRFVAPEFLVGISILYLTGCYFGKITMSNRPPVSLGHLPILYDLFQVLLSLYMAWGIFGPKGLDSKILFGLNDKHTAHLEYFVWVHYWSKMLDFMDTVVILLKKNDRQFNVLHVYHHASIVVIWGLLLHFDVGNGTTAYGAGLNSIIHAIMYTHYLISALGYQNPFKKYLTRAQLLQFFLCVCHSLVVGLFEDSSVHPWWVLQFVYQLSMLYLFMDFYKRTYSETSKEGKGEVVQDAAAGNGKEKVSEKRE